jgi:hypothetical protein
MLHLLCYLLTEKKSADSTTSSVHFNPFKLTHLAVVIAPIRHWGIVKMLKAKQFDVKEKSKIMAWFSEGVTAKEIVQRLRFNAAIVRKIVASNRDMPLYATPPPAKKRCGHSRNATPTQEERLRSYVLPFLLKTARELKKEMAGWQDKSMKNI